MTKLKLIAIDCMFAGVLLASQLTSAATATAAPVNAVTQRVLALETSVNDAYGANDLPKYFSFYWDDLTQWFPEGRVSLPDYQKTWTAFIKAGNKLESVKTSDMHVSVSPLQDSAVATYRLDVRTKMADGKITTEAFQETDVWFKRKGQWKIITLHYSPAGK